MACSVPYCDRPSQIGRVLCRGHYDLGKGIDSIAAREVQAAYEELPPERRSPPPGSSVPQRADLSPSSWLHTAGVFVAVLAVVSAAAALIGGVALLVHTNPLCETNPFDDSLSSCTGSSHPFAGAGAAVLIGGLVQAAFLAIVSRVCIEVGQLRTATIALLQQTGLGLKSGQWPYILEEDSKDDDEDGAE